MKRWFSLALVLAAACGGSPTRPAAPATPAATATPAAVAAGPHQEQIAQIDAFLADPANVAPTSLLEHVSASSDAQVAIPGDLMSLTTGAPDPAPELLLVGFALGNARAQLASGVAKDDFVAGIRGMLRVHDGLELSLPELVEARRADQAGTLETWAKDWQVRHPTVSGE